MSPIPPIFCGTILAAVIAAGASHYWSIEKIVSNHPSILMSEEIPENNSALPLPLPIPSSEPTTTAPPIVAIAKIEDSPAGSEEPHSEEFFERLIQELRNLRSENQALNNQIAETNRDIMKMQFQIDTHSESFRPLPASQERGDTTYGLDFDLPGVLPPRAEPVFQADQ